MNERPMTGTPRRNRLVAVLAVLALGAAGFVGYTFGNQSRVVTEDVGCLSATGVIGCTLADGWDVSIPLGVSWSEADGTLHEGGRPQCLPPTGRGLEGPVRVTWTDVDVDGRGWRQVLHVACLD